MDILEEDDLFPSGFRVEPKINLKLKTETGKEQIKTENKVESNADNNTFQTIIDFLKCIFY